VEDDAEENPDEEDDDGPHHHLNEAEMKELIAAMRLQAMENYPFMFQLPEDPNAMDTDNMTYE